MSDEDTTGDGEPEELSEAVIEPTSDSDTDSHPIADLSTGAPPEPQAGSRPFADLSEMTHAAPGPGSGVRAVIPETDTKLDLEAREAPTEELIRDDTLPDAEEPAKDAEPEAEPEAAEPKEPEATQATAPEAPAAEPPPKTSGWLILAPVLVAPALMGILLALGLPQAFIRGVSGADTREPNDTIAEAVLLEPGVTEGMRCGPGDVDWYRVEIPPGKCLQLKTEPPPNGPGATSVHALDGSTRVKTPFGEIRCVYAPEGLQEETVAVRVWGERSVPYQIDVAFLDPAVRFEPNNSPTDAAPIQLGRHERLRCNGSDWYLLKVPPWRTFVASVDTQSAGVGLRLLPTTFDFASITSATFAKTQTLPALGAGRSLYLEVRGGGDYALDLKLGESKRPERSTATGAKVFKGTFEPNQTREAAKPIEAGSYPQLRCDGKDWYVLQVPAQTTLTASLRYSLRYGDLRMRLEDEGLAKLRYARQDDDVLRTRLYADKATKVYLLVEGGSVAYRLKVDMSPGLPGTLLAAGEYPDLAYVPNEVWRVPVGKGQKIEVELNYDAADGWMNLLLYDLSMGNVGPSTSGSGRATRSFVSGSEQPMFIEVRGSPIRYQLKISLTQAEGVAKGFNAYAHMAGPGVYPKRKLVTEAYYALRLRHKDQVSATAKFAEEGGDVDLELIGKGGQTLAAATGSDSEERLEYTSLKNQLVYLRAYTFHNDELEYDLTIAVNGRSRPDGNRTLPPATERVRHNNGQRVYRIALAAGETLTAVSNHDVKDGQLDLWLQDGNGRLVSEAKTDGPAETLTYTAEAAGDVYVRVRGDRAPFTITFRKDGP